MTAFARSLLLVGVVTACRSRIDSPAPPSQPSDARDASDAAHPMRNDAATEGGSHVVEARTETESDRIAKATFADILRDVAALKSRCPELAEFDPLRHASNERMVLSYDYHTHRPEHLGGWRGGVPEPNDDGVWLYIDLHDPSSRAQLHTQPIGLPTYKVADRLLLFIMLEGRTVARCAPAVQAAVERRVRRAQAQSPVSPP
jgi:hypothetical protein